MNRFRIELLGSSFTIESDQDDQSMSALVSRFEEAVSLARSQTGAADPLKLAIIGGLILADEVASLRDAQASAGDSEGGGDPGMDEAERIALKLLSDLEERLGD